MLTDSQIKKIKPPIGKAAPDKYSDGNNLYLHVFASGGKRWIMDYRFEGKRKAFSIICLKPFAVIKSLESMIPRLLIVSIFEN